MWQLRVGDRDSFSELSFLGFPGGMLRDIAQGTRKFRVPGYPGSNTRRVIRRYYPCPNGYRSDRSGYYPSGTRVIDERGTTLSLTVRRLRRKNNLFFHFSF